MQLGLQQVRIFSVYSIFMLEWSILYWFPYCGCTLCPANDKDDRPTPNGCHFHKKTTYMRRNKVVGKLENVAIDCRCYDNWSDFPSDVVKATKMNRQKRLPHLWIWQNFIYKIDLVKNVSSFVTRSMWTLPYARIYFANSSHSVIIRLFLNYSCR